MAQRLDKLVSEACGVSRQQARRLVLSGAVKVDGKVCRDIGGKFEASSLVVGGQAVTHQSFVYIMLNKPQGVVSASRDKKQSTVVDLVRGSYPRRTLFPAGRLDKDSEGFVLLTDDGALAHRILAPKNHLPKTYVVTLDTPFTQEMADGFAEGLVLADGSRTLPAQAQATQNPLVCQVVLHEGMYHQIKRMFGRFGAGVNGLRRVKIGGVTLDESLASGAYRELTREELEALERE